MKRLANIVSKRLQAHLQSLRLLTLLAILILAQPLAALAQTNAPSPLPPAVQEAVNKGIIAAKARDYLLAIRYFEEARKIAPYAPVIYLNMGLAESKIPGRELRAIAWFGAYLAAYPDAPNAAAVKEQISALEVKNQVNTSRFLKTVQDVTNQLTNSRKYFRSVPVLSFEKSDALKGMIELWAKTGDIAAAINTANISEYDDRPYNYYTISKIQAESGDIDGAKKTAELIQDPDYKKRAKEAIEKAKTATASDVKQPTVSDWLLKLGIYGRDIYPRFLNETPFLDLNNYLLSQKASLPSRIAHEKLQDEMYRRSDAQVYFYGIHETAKTIVKEQNEVHKMLKRGVGK